jgi:CBS domain-containing protein
MDFELNLHVEKVAAIEPAAPLAVEPGTPVRDIMELLKAQDSGSVMICRDGALVGIFTERDALKLMARGADMNVPIETVMSANPVTIRSADAVGKAIKMMSQGGYRRLPIVDDEGRPQGLLKTSHIVHYLVEHVPEAVYNLPPEPDPVMEQREGA